MQTIMPQYAWISTPLWSQENRCRQIETVRDDLP